MIAVLPTPGVVLPAECRHHWVIEPAGNNGGRTPTSPGTCKHCGAEREFANSVAYLSPREVSAGHRGRASRAAREAVREDSR